MGTKSTILTAVAFGKTPGAVHIGLIPLFMNRKGGVTNYQGTVLNSAIKP